MKISQQYYCQSTINCNNFLLNYRNSNDDGRKKMISTISNRRLFNLPNFFIKKVLIDMHENNYIMRILAPIINKLSFEELCYVVAHISIQGDKENLRLIIDYYYKQNNCMTKNEFRMLSQFLDHHFIEDYKNLYRFNLNNDDNAFFKNIHKRDLYCISGLLEKD